MPLRRLVLLMAFALGAAAASLAGVRHINVREGLASRQVYDVEEDDDGFIWVFSNAGMDRYDGHAVKHYPLDGSKRSNDHILSATTLRRAPDGALWVSVKSGALYRYDRTADRFDNTFNMPDTAALIYDFVFSPQGEPVVCASTGVYLCPEGGAPRKVALDGHFTDAIAGDGHGAYYVGTDNGVYRMDGTTFRTTPVAGTEGVYVKSLCVQGGHLFVGPFDSPILMVRLSDHRVGRLPFHIPPMPVNAMVGHGAGEVLIGVDGAGAYLVDATTGKLIRRYHDDDTDSALSGNTVTDVLVDRNDGLWVSTSHKGLNYIAPFTRSVEVERKRTGDPQSIVSDYVNSVLEDADGDYWYGTDKGISRRDTSCRWHHYLQDPGMAASVVLALASDPEGRIWAGSYGNGVSIIDKRGGRAERLPVRAPGGNWGIGTDYVFAIHSDADGAMWIGGINGPTTRYDMRTRRYSYYDEDCIAVMVPDRDGSLIFGGNKGLGKYNLRHNCFTWNNLFDSVRIQYPVRCIGTDREGEVLWIGTTGDGLVRYDRKKGTAKRLTTADGLSSNTIYSVTRDRADNMWVCTETDLYRLDPEGEKCVKFTNYLGDGSGEFNPGAAIINRNGCLMLGTADGCAVFFPEEEMGEPTHRDILLTDFKLHGRTMMPGEAGSPLKANINLTDHVRLGHSQNSIDIDFSVADFVSPRRVGFAYMLEGRDKDFCVADKGHRASYSELEPGDYTFRVRAVDTYTGKMLSERSLAITVEQPMWLSWWAKLLYALALAAVGVLVYGYIRNRNRERSIEAQIQTFSAMAHDIRSPMSLIKAPLLNIEMEKDLSDNARSNLAQARMSVDKTMEMLTEMLELQRDSRHRSRLSVEPCDIGEFLQVKAEEFAMLAQFKGLTIECDVPAEMPAVPVDREVLSHIVDNLVSNAIKYTSQGKVTLRARMSRGNRWELSVSDTGIGIARDDARRIFRQRHRSADAVEADSSGLGMGLLITKRLVRFHKGSIGFDSRRGDGTTFAVTLPTKFAERYMAQQSKDEKPDDAAPEEGAGEESTRPRIFVIEDDADLLAYMKQTLGTEYDVTASGDALQMLEAIRRDNPDLIITDVMMPRLRGDELCRMVKTDMATSHIPVILLSGLASRHDIVAGLEAHADDYVVKPFDIVVLKARIRNIIKSRRQLNNSVIAGDREPEDEDYTNELDRSFMTKVMAAVDAHLSDSEFAVGDLCAELGMSRTSVYNKIKALTGQSLNEFIRIVRLNRSKELLATRRYNISEVAYMVGFSDPKYFSTCFKKQFGVSPSKV